MQYKVRVLLLQEKTTYKSILYKTYFVMEFAATHYNTCFVLKTDDDAFVNIQPLMQQLKLLCRTAECENERIYMVCPLPSPPTTTLICKSLISFQMKHC